jgi:hypothetical protein
MSPLHSFLACYSYGQGGVWLLLAAPSLAEAQARYPRLKVFAARPPWMSEAEEQSYREECERKGYRWHIDRPSGWLLQHSRGQQ